MFLGYDCKTNNGIIVYKVRGGMICLVSKELNAKRGKADERNK